MIKLVVINNKTFEYRVFEGSKCVAHFIEESKAFLSAEEVEEMRTGNYKTA